MNWKQNNFDKFETTKYRDFEIVHHFRNMAKPYRVTVWGPRRDEILFGAESEEDIVWLIDDFYEKFDSRDTLLYDNKFLFIRGVGSLNVYTLLQTATGLDDLSFVRN